MAAKGASDSTLPTQRENILKPYSSLTVLGTPGSMGMFPFVRPGPMPDFDFRIKNFASTSISDETFADRAKRYPLDTPDTKEAYWIREHFENSFPKEAAAKTAVRYVPTFNAFIEIA